MNFADTVEIIGKIVDGGGVAIILIGIVIATLSFLRQRPGSAAETSPDRYTRYRQNLGRALLLGLELLVAGDIIRTVAIAPTIESVLVLALIVVVRTFLSWSLEVELSGRWPWQRPDRQV